ncbi:MAG: glycosyltransferase family 4 protein [Pseudomonadota bacterium]
MESDRTRAEGPADASTGGAKGKGGRPVVLQVLPRLETGGVERGTVQIAQAIVEAGGTALVASEGGALEPYLKRAGATHFALPMASKNPWTMLRNTDRLMALIARYEIQVVHARSRAPAWSAMAACKRGGAHFVTTFHGTYNFKSELKRRYNGIMTQGERVIANSQFIARHIKENYKINPARLRVVQRGVDLLRFDPDSVAPERLAKLAAEWRLDDGVPVVLLPARLTRWKGQQLLLEALSRLDDLDLRCVMVGADQGRSAYRQELEREITTRGMAGRAFLLDHCEDMAAAYRLADVVVNASIEPEAFGRVIGEGQAMGRPVVAADHGGAPEQVTPGETGFLFAPGDPDALADALRQALSLSEADREALGERAIAHVRAHFSLEQMCRKTLAVYDELLIGQAGPP